ncbi:haloacid dehalogenase-like hydrolase [Candidatus Vidania fulgoroideorum]
MTKKIYVFDLDKTITSIDTEYNWVRYLKKNKMICKKKYKEAKKFYCNYEESSLNFKKYIIFFNKLNNNIKNIKKHVKKYVNSFIKKRIYKRVFKIIKSKDNPIISTASNYLISNEIRKILKVKKMFCTKFKKKKIIKNYKIHKVINLSKWIAKKNYKDYMIHFYTDSINDLPMINFSEKVTLINPKKNLLKRIYKKISIFFIKKHIQIT